jgi:hypothetical protein
MMENQVIGIRFSAGAKELYIYLYPVDTPVEP